MALANDLERQRAAGVGLLQEKGQDSVIVTQMSDDELLAAVMAIVAEEGMTVNMAAWLLTEAMLNGWPYFPHEAAMMAGEVPNTLFQTGAEIKRNHGDRRSETITGLADDQVYELTEFPLGIPGDSWPLIDIKGLPSLAVIQMIARAYQFMYPPSDDDGLLTDAEMERLAVRSKEA